RVPDAVKYLTKYLQVTPKDTKSLMLLIQHLLTTDKAPAIIRFLETIRPTTDSGNAEELLLASILINSKTLSEHYYHICTSQRIPLNKATVLRYALLTGDKALFDRTFGTGKHEKWSSDLILSAVLASVLYNDPSYLSANEEQFEHVEQVKKAVLQIIARQQ